MNRRVFRFFFDFLDGQVKWLNGMASQGYRLRACGKLSYVFEECEPGAYEYAVVYVGNESGDEAQKYRQYLESMGFRAFTKNINLNFSMGKLRWRPYAKVGGQIATLPGALNKELLILEKKKDGTSFELHTTARDKQMIYSAVRNMYMYAAILLAVLCVVTFMPGVVSLTDVWANVLRSVLGVITVCYLVPTVRYTMLAKAAQEQSRLFD